MWYIHFLPSIFNAITDIATYYCVIPKIVILHDGIKTIQNVFFFIFFKKTGFCKKTRKPGGLGFLEKIQVFLNLNTTVRLSVGVRLQV